MTTDNMKNLFLDLLALMLFIGILVALAETRLYPVALGAVIIAFVYIIISDHGTNIVNQWDNLIKSASSRLNQGVSSQ